MDLPTIESAFQGYVEPVEASRAYKAGMLLVAAFMVLIVLVYATLAIGVTAGLIWHAVHHYSLIARPRLGVFICWMLYVVPLVILLLLILFLLKPLFAKRASQSALLALNPEVEPVLYGFIARVCAMVGAPMPARIDLDCHLNARASLEKTAMGEGRLDLVLTIGLPLMGGLTAQQFAGVVAHEFGHFNQRRAMRLGRLVYGISAWLSRLAYEPDAWDLYLQNWSDPERNPWGTVIVAVARSGVGVARALFRCLFHLGNVAMCFLSRQMELDADRCEYFVAGSETFEATFRRLRFLNRAVSRAYDAVRNLAWQGKILPPDFPAFVLDQESRLDSYVRSRIEAAMATERRKVFSSHPPDAERIRRAREAAAPGLVQLRGQASELLGNFDALASQITALHYAEDLHLLSGRRVLVSNRGLE